MIDTYRDISGVVHALVVLQEGAAETVCQNHHFSLFPNIEPIDHQVLQSNICWLCFRKPSVSHNPQGLQTW